MRFLVFAACGTLFTFVMTALGAALVFFFRRPISETMNRSCLGFAGGVMSAAAVFSLLLPARQMAAQAGQSAWLVLSLGFALGAAAIRTLDKALCRARSSVQTAARRETLLFSAITLHNIPEGMAVGLAFALCGAGQTPLAAACALALGVGVQNLPEGAAIALPLRQSGMSRGKSFALGAASGAVEPVFGVLAALAAVFAQPFMPFLMAVAAGAMMIVVYQEMIPSACEAKDGLFAAMVGYLMMMALDIALG